jgi:alpha-galactosidase
MAKITLVGAGSVEFTRVLLADLAAYPELADSTIALHDIDPGRLDTATRIAQDVNQVAGSQFAFESHLKRRPALDGADFVVNEIQVGGLQATMRDFEIPTAHGVRQTIGDTLGVGGVFRALRTIPVMLEIARDVNEVCPEAWLLNYTNPMAMLMWALDAAGAHTRMVGLCHSVQNTHEQLAEMIGLPEPEITYQTAGVNHQSFVLRFERDGESLYPRLDEAIERDPEGLARRVRIELYRRLGYFPTESSEHSAEYLPWFMRHDDQIEHFRIPVDEYIRRSLENIDEYEQTRARLAAGEPLELTPEGELAPRYIHAMVTGRSRIEHGNVPNDGLIDNLPNRACVEVPCRVDADGVHPIAVGALPAPCAALNRTFLNVVELTVRAALEESRELVHQAVLLDPNAAATLTTAQSRAMVDELIEAHGELLPEGIRAGGRPPAAATEKLRRA